MWLYFLFWFVYFEQLDEAVHDVEAQVRHVRAELAVVVDELDEHNDRAEDDVLLAVDEQIVVDVRRGRVLSWRDAVLNGHGGGGALFAGQWHAKAVAKDVVDDGLEVALHLVLLPLLALECQP